MESRISTFKNEKKNLKKIKMTKTKISQKHFIVFGWLEAISDTVCDFIIFFVFGNFRFFGWVCGFWFGLNFFNQTLMNSVHEFVGFPFSVGKTSKMMCAKGNKIAADNNAIWKYTFPVNRLVDDFDWKRVY